MLNTCLRLEILRKRFGEVTSAHPVYIYIYIYTGFFKCNFGGPTKDQHLNSTPRSSIDTHNPLLSELCYLICEFDAVFHFSNFGDAILHPVTRGFFAEITRNFKICGVLVFGPRFEVRSAFLEKIEARFENL